MADKDESLTKAAAAYDAMLAEVLRNAANGIIPGPLEVSDHLAAGHIQDGQTDASGISSVES